MSFSLLSTSTLFFPSNILCNYSDLKPENLLLDGAKNVKIADFGLSSAMVRTCLVLPSF